MGDKYLDMYERKDFEKVRENAPGTNYAENYNLFVGPLTKLRQAYSGDANGWVDSEVDPYTAYIARMRPSTIAHEAAHTQQNAANFYDIVQPRNRGSDAYRQELSGIKSVLSQLREKYPNLVGENLGDSSREIMANLQGIEATLPAGTNVFDTLDLPKAYRRLLEHRIFPMSDKLFESDYQKPDAPLKSNESIFQYLKRKLSR